MDLKNNLEKYARLAVEIGVNLQPNQTLLLKTPISCYEFARKIVDVAYEVGAKDIDIEWYDEECSLIRFLKAPDEIFDTFPNWKIEKYNELLEEGVCILHIDSSNPTIYKDVDPKKIQRSSKVSNKSLPKWREAVLSDKLRWSIVSVPSESWASKVFPDLNTEEAISKLWDYIFKCTRIDTQDPVKAWKEHNGKLHDKVKYLNENKFKSIHLKSNKTDLHIELPKGHLWAGGSGPDTNDIYFNANIPTEEIFTLPHKFGVNGVVSNTKPLIYGGNIVDNFTLTFKDGKVVDYTAEVGYESLKSLIELDEGSCYLGEVALVENNSPISNTGIIYYTTLYDENASCHLALGSAYRNCLENGVDIPKEELDDYGINDSLTHVDFMVGSADMNIVGITKEGDEIPLFKDGNWI